jgi:acid phosphatase type 7
VGVVPAEALRLVPAIVLLALVVLLSSAQPAYADNIGGAGDISAVPTSSNRADVATAALLGQNAIGLVHTYGDNQYECGEYPNFLGAYDKSWGKYKFKTRPAPGNHEYIANYVNCLPGTTGTMISETLLDTGGAGYYRYFQGRTPGHPGYYSYNYQGWHFVVLNTTCTNDGGGVVPGGCGGPMLDWLRADLAANRAARCTVVYGHHPYIASAAPTTGNRSLSVIWPTLVTENVDLYIAGHNHAYERLKPMRTKGNVDADWGPNDGDDGHAGIPQIVAGTGGRSLLPFTSVHPNSAFRLSGHYGIFKIVPDYPSAGQWLQAFKGTDTRTYDRVPFRCH